MNAPAIENSFVTKPALSENKIIYLSIYDTTRRFINRLTQGLLLLIHIELTSDMHLIYVDRKHNSHF